ncbi:MAG: hypothetical protein E7363_04735 [Clostridiales bacterium]|nr:hypothetical protein [Clostridiales bacterium]
MKKTLVALLAIVSVFCTFCLTACGGSKEASIAGTYKFFSMTETYNGETETTNVGDEIYPGIIITEDFMVVELKEDGTFIAMMEGEESGTGTWVKSGNNVVVTPTGEGNDEDETVTFKLDGDTLTMEETEEYEGETYSSTMVLKKAQNSNTSPSTTPTTAPTVTPSVSESSIVGTYKFFSMKIGDGITVNAGAEFNGFELTEDYMVLELKSDNTVSMTVEGEDSGTGTWVKSGNNVVLTVEGEAETYTLDGETLSWTFTEEGENYEIVFKKAQNTPTVTPTVAPTVAPSVAPSISESSIVGTYKFQSMSMTYEGVTQTVNAGDTYSGVTLDENYIVMELKEDGTAKMSTTLAGTLVDESIGTWVQDGGNVVITIDDEPEIATIYGDFLIIEGTNEGYTNEVVLKK